MKRIFLLFLLTIIGVSHWAPQTFAQRDDAEEDAQKMPKPDDVSAPRKGAPPAKMKKPPSAKATPIEIPGGGQKAVVKKKPSVDATPIEIPGHKQKAVVKQKPSVIVPTNPSTGTGEPQIKPPPPRGTTPN